jgi:hypothetical protein
MPALFPRNTLHCKKCIAFAQGKEMRFTGNAPMFPRGGDRPVAVRFFAKRGKKKSGEETKRMTE